MRIEVLPNSFYEYHAVELAWVVLEALILMLGKSYYIEGGDIGPLQ